MRALSIGQLVRVVCVALVVAPPALAAVQQTPEQRPGAEVAASRAEGRPFLWRIEGEVPRYLLGTFHLPDERVTDLDPEVERVLASADALFTEVEEDQAPSPVLMKALLLPDGKQLKDVAPADVIARLQEHLGSKPGDDPGTSKLRPVMLSIQVVLQKRRALGEPLDLMIYRDAKSAGKEVGGLETMEEQLAAFDGLGIDGEVAVLKATLDRLDDYRKRGLDLTEEMINAWCAGDTQRTLGFFDEMSGDGSWRLLSRTLLTDRNLRMAERIDRKLHASPRTKFVFAVGTGHLIGGTNVVDLLRARGYVVSRVPETIANLDEELDQLQREVAQRQQRIELLLAKKATIAARPVKKAG